MSMHTNNHSLSPMRGSNVHVPASSSSMMIMRELNTSRDRGGQPPVSGGGGGGVGGGGMRDRDRDQHRESQPPPPITGTDEWHRLSERLIAAEQRAMAISAQSAKTFAQSTRTIAFLEGEATRLKTLGNRPSIRRPSIPQPIYPPIHPYTHPSVLLPSTYVLFVSTV